MPRDGYLRFEPSIEQPRPDEPETIKTIVASIKRTNASSFAARSHAIRQQHAKGQGFLKGELTVYDDLPDHLRQGMFATARSYPIIVRLSTAFGDIRSDRIRVPRGMAIKVLGVSGPKALPEDNSTNQDFLLVNHKSYFSEGAIRFGDYVAKLCAAPVSESVLRLTGQPAYKDDNALLNSVVEFFSRNSAEYELRAQLCTDLQRTPVEDASIEWPEEISPHQPLGRITLRSQAADSPARRAYTDDVLSFDPWRCLADHQPLGSIMRLRKEAYRVSRTFRHEKNQQPMKEPQNISEFPD